MEPYPVSTLHLYYVVKRVSLLEGQLFHQYSIFYLADLLHGELSGVDVTLAVDIHDPVESRGELDVGQDGVHFVDQTFFGQGGCTPPTAMLVKFRGWTAMAQFVLRFLDLEVFMLQRKCVSLY